MKQQSQYLFSLFFFLFPGLTGRAQPDSLLHHADSIQRHRIAVFVPLYLDSAFDDSSNYRYDKNFPKFINPGLEFYEGAQLAIDSLETKRLSLEVHIYDTRSSTHSIAQVLQSPDFRQTELIIGHVNATELHQLADAAASNNIPFINVNFPNDGGITNNPDFVILNSTLKTHCESIYKFIQRNYPTSNLLFLKTNGVLEDRLKNYFVDIGKNTASVPLKLNYISLSQPVDAGQLTPYLDSTRKNICIVGSLDENFAKNICAQFALLNKTYPLKIFGMPTWDAISDFSQPAYADQEIYYTTPFYMNPNDSLVASIQQFFKTRFYSRPSDMVFRGYETMFRFAQLLQEYGHNLSGSIGEKKFKVFNDFDIEPVFLNKQNLTLDYFENKKLYFIKKVNGNVVAVY
ncbi:MAG TPA: ABC transporter substrate-binding protein [Puia sp.]|nr:ABC transporter substrate-binding protein [Puia sp.]